MDAILAQVICSEFTNKVGKFQERNPVPKAMKLTFSLPMGPNEEGYRNMDLYIYGPMNYVGVYCQERWDYIPSEELEEGEDGEDVIKADSPGYRKDKGPFILLGYHDSGWRGAVQSFLREHKDRLGTLGTGEWYKLVDAAKINFEEAVRQTG